VNKTPRAGNADKYWLSARFVATLCRVNVAPPLPSLPGIFSTPEFIGTNARRMQIV
jgi:hypothetical protein